MPGLEALSLALRKVPDCATSAASWRALTGDAFPLVERALVRTRDVAQGWPCGAPGGADWGCSRTLVEHDRHDVVAVGEDGICPTEKIARGDAVRQLLDLAKLGDLFAPSLHLHALPDGGRTAKVVGVPATTAYLGLLRLDRTVAVALTLARTLVVVGARGEHR